MVYLVLEMISLFDKRLICTGAAVLIVAVASLVLSSAPEIPEIAPMNENVSGVEREPFQESQAEPEAGAAGDYAYTIREHNGRIAVFPKESAQPELILDVLVKYLPDLDRTQMQNGIQVKDYEELVRLIEDYTS